MEHICATIERDVRELLAMHSSGSSLGNKGEAADALVAAAVRRDGGCGSMGLVAAPTAAAVIKVGDP